MSSLLKQISAIAHSGKFDALLRGVEIKLPTGESITLRAGKTIRSMRPQGLRFCKYSFVTEVHAGEFIGYGFGEDDSQILSLQKSIAEGCERAIYFALKGTAHGTLNTNGWSAHLDIDSARQAAIEELIERDAVLVHWLSHQPMQVLDETQAPKWITNWVKNELSLSRDFTDLRILVSNLGFLPVVTTVLLKKDSYGVLSSAAGSTLEDATRKALAETCRIGHIALEQKEFSDEVVTPIDHAMLFTKNNLLPAWLFGKTVDWATTAKNWKSEYASFDQSKINPKFQKLVSAPLVIGHCSSNEIQNLYFGRTEIAQSKGLINFGRLNKALQGREINLAPHGVA